MDPIVGFLQYTGFCNSLIINLKTNSKNRISCYVRDSVDETVSVNSEKSNHIITIQKYITNPTPSMRGFASIIVSVISIFAAVPIGKLQHKTLGKEEILLLKKNVSNFKGNKTKN